MAIVTALVTLDLHDYLGDGFDTRRTKLYVTNNVPGESIFDTDTGETWVGGGSASINADGTAEVVVPTPGDSNPASWQTTIHLDYSDPATRARKVRPFGPFTITGNALLADLVEEQEIPPTYLTTVTTLLDGYVTDAEAAAASAESDANRAEDARDGIVGDLGTTDSQTATLIGSPSLTQTALTDSYVGTPKFGGLLPAPLTDAVKTVIDPTTGVWVCDAIGNTFYGSRQSRIWSSADGITWADVCATPAANIVLGLRATSDGQVVAIMDTGLYKSSGWGTGSVTWSHKITPNGLAAPQAFSLDGGDPANPGSKVCTKLIYAEYGPGAGQAWTDSRYAYVSTDSGTTWTAEYDSDAESGNAAVDSHLHGVCYDPWNDTFYVSEGHSTGGGIYHSTDDGATWDLAPGMAILQAGSASPTSITATDTGLVCGSDSDNSQGVYGVVRTADPMDQQLVYLWAWRAPRSGNNGWGAKAVRDVVTGLVYIAWKSQGAGLSPLITGGTPSGAGLVWEATDTPVTSDAFEYLAVTDSGRLAAFGIIGGVQVTVTGTLGRPAAVTEPDKGGYRGGVAKDAKSTALGRGASTGTATRALAVGQNTLATQDGVAVGDVAQNTGTNAVAVGHDAVASATSVAVGDATDALGGTAVAVGAGAQATGGNVVAVGRNANATTQNVAIGYAAAAAVGSDSVSLGQNTTGTGSKQIAVGPRHVEYTEMATEAAAPAANQTRVYTLDDGAGNTQYRVRFNGTSKIIKLASQLGTNGLGPSQVPYTTVARPSAVTAGAGASYYDTTLSKPAWSDGTVWRDAAGTAV